VQWFCGEMIIVDNLLILACLCFCFHVRSGDIADMGE